MTSTLRVHALDPAPHFLAAFETILQTRFAGVPAINPALQVEPRGFRRWGNDWIGIMITPWSVFAVYAAGNAAGWEHAAAGMTRLVELPGGDFPFKVIEDDEAGLYAALSLMSPASALADQETARSFADTCIGAMLTASRLPDDDEDADAVLSIPPTADGKLHRVIPIRATAPKNWTDTPALTPKAPQADPPSPRGPISRRELFGGRRKQRENATGARTEAAAPADVRPAEDASPRKEDADV